MSRPSGAVTETTGGRLEVVGVSRRFGGVTALADVSVAVPAGATLGVIGPNGSGKTTLVNVITGFTRPDRGDVLLDGRRITGRAPHRVARLGVARTFQTARPFHRLSATASLVVPLLSPRARRAAGAGRWGHRRAVALDLLEEVGFERDSPVPTRTASALPQGYLRRLELARCLAMDARVILTDELFSGLSHAEVAGVLPLLEKLRARGVTLVLVEHRLPELMTLADRILVLSEGRVIADGPPTDVAEDPAVREVYLG